MSELSKTYNPLPIENKWYSNWLENKYFHATPDERPAFSIVIPPPNVTGVLHMGHMLNNTIQDVLTRRARMQGKNALWVPGTDHASIATEAKVVQHLRKKQIKKSDLGRDEFLTHAWEWKEKHGGIILDQLKKLGASCDWERTRFTMDEKYYEAVIKIFVDLHKKGYIYRGLRMINWDCEAQTALSNEEVIYREEGESSFMYSIRYAIKDSDESIVVATQRPETIPGDTAVAVNPNDTRYKHLIGKKAIIPFVNREVSIIGDDYVEPEFGTGCLKVTPAHDPNDYEIGQRHGLEVIDTIDFDGRMNEKTGVSELIGLDRFDAREKIVEMLQETGILVDRKEFMTKIGRSERTDSVVEPKLSLQWFIDMQKISKRALEAVENDEVRLHPAKFKNTYRHWMENVRDWCISRQLWWGHRIPAWYLPNGEFVVAENEHKALGKAQKIDPKLTLDDLKQDEDVLDTWASSWLWPIAVFDGFEDYDVEEGHFTTKNKDLEYFYPTDVLVTAPEILFFWVARMIIAGYEYMGEKPFKDVYLTGIVRDKQGRKMSKSLGNSPDPLQLIETFSADGVRVGMLFSSPAGNDLLFDEALCEQGRNFANKIWNAFRLVQSWEIADKTPDAADKLTMEWFENRLAQAVVEINDAFEKYRLSDALKHIYKLFWDEFCSWYLELIKPTYGEPIAKETFEQTRVFFEHLLRLLHPFMPFITEELWHHLKQAEFNETIQFQPWLQETSFDQDYLDHFELLRDLVTAVRTIRSEKNIIPSAGIKLFIKTTDAEKAQWISSYSAVFQKLAHVEHIQAAPDLEKPPKSTSTVSRQQVIYIPLEGVLDLEQERAKTDKEIQRLNSFLKGVNAKLANQNFVANAPEEVVEKERQKKRTAEENIEKLRALLNDLT